MSHDLKDKAPKGKGDPLSRTNHADNNKTTGGQNMWGGRFNVKPDDVMQAINASIDVDKHLYRQDIQGSIAHVTMLEARGLIDSADQEKIIKGLKVIEGEIEDGTFIFDPALEDIHMHVEARLIELVGDAGARLHTARSRNDQVATDFRLWIRDSIDRFDVVLGETLLAFLNLAERHAETIMPGFTHLQTAQPVTFGHHLMAYYEMLSRDRTRLSDCRERLNECPLGAAALAGTGFAIDRFMTSDQLGFRAPMRNSLDAVSARDFAIEYLSALAILGSHLSRFAEEVVIFASAPYGFYILSDRFSTGSSIMPQKRNPDAAELVRAKAGRLQGLLSGFLAVMKGLPLAYSKDMQEDKKPVFEASEDMALMLAATKGMVEDLKVDEIAMRTQAAAGYSTATDLADWLVRALKLPFRKAHHITGSLVKMAEENGVPLEALTLDEMQSVEAGINEEIYYVLSVENSVRSRTSYGGTAPSAVHKMIREARKDLS